MFRVLKPIAAVALLAVLVGGGLFSALLHEVHHAEAAQRHHHPIHTAEGGSGWLVSEAFSAADCTLCAHLHLTARLPVVQAALSPEARLRQGILPEVLPRAPVQSTRSRGPPTGRLA